MSFTLTDDTSFYEVRDFLIKRDAILFTEKQIKYLSEKNLLVDLQVLKGWDAYNVMRALLDLISKFNYKKAPTIKREKPNKRRDAHLKKIQSYKKFLCSIYRETYVHKGVAYGKYEMIGINAPEYAHQHYNHLLELEKSIEDKSTLEGSRYYAPPPKITKKDFKDFFDEVREIYKIKITPSNVTKLLNKI